MPSLPSARTLRAPARDPTVHRTPGCRRSPGRVTPSLGPHHAQPQADHRRRQSPGHQPHRRLGTLFPDQSQHRTEDGKRPIQTCHEPVRVPRQHQPLVEVRSVYLEDVFVPAPSAQQRRRRIRSRSLQPAVSSSSNRRHPPTPRAEARAYRLPPRDPVLVGAGFSLRSLSLLRSLPLRRSPPTHPAG